jgi:tetratricopeptide (TPR) repeat protein
MKRQDRKPPARKPRTLWPLQLAALALITIIVYANGLRGSFVFDDQQIVMQNPALMNVRTFGDVIALGAGWRQLLFFTYGLNYYWSGLDTFSYHAVNLFLHIENVLLVYAIILVALRENATANFAALAGAAVFSVHTLLSGAVTYIAGRSSVLCATFYFAAILFFFKALDSAKTSARLMYFVLTAAAWLLAFQAKQEAITLPLFLAAVAFLRTEKKDWRVIAALAAIPVVAVAAMRGQIAALYESVTKNQILVSAGFEEVLSPAAYFRTYITSVVGYYFPRFVVPTDLSADPHILPVEQWYSPEFIFSIVVLAGLTWMTLRFSKQEPLFSLGITALLVSPLMAYAAIPLADVVLEHRAYIPGLGVAFLFAWAFQWIARNYANARWVIFAVVVAIFGVMTVNRNPVFANNIALWEDAERKAPAKPRPHFNLGQAYQQTQRLDDAIREYEHALALKPDIHAAYSNIAAIYLDRKQYDKGEEVLRRITTLAPDFTEGFINLGVLFIRRTDPDSALKPLERALELNPDSFAAHFNKGEALTQKRDFKAAVESYKQAVRLRPDLAAFRLSLGMGYLRAGDRESAEKEFLKLTDGPNAAEAYRNLGMMYNDADQPDQAIRYFKQAALIRNVYPELHHDFAVAYMRKQMWKEAIEELQLTIQQQPDYGPAFLNLALAYQMGADTAMARQTLQTYLDRYGSSNSQYVAQVRARLAALN